MPHARNHSPIVQLFFCHRRHRSPNATGTIPTALTAGHSPEKAKLNIKTEEGRVLSVPVLTASPVNYELEVMQFIPLHDGEVMLCKIRNILQDDTLAKGEGSAAEKLAAIAPVHTTCQTYFGWNGTALGAWGEPMAKLAAE